jgi:carboxyl-terminal processing protease
MRLVLAALAIAAPVLTLSRAHAGAEPAPAPEASAPAEAVPLHEVRTFTDMFAKIKASYVEEVTDKELIESAMRGMLSELDPHSAYLKADAFRELKENTTGEFGGLGMEVGMDDGFVRVISPIDDTPAQRAGIKAGDIIIKLDDTPVRGLTLDDAITRMRGKPGTFVTLMVARDGADKPLKFVLTRAIIRVQSVKQRILEPGFAYLRVSNFHAHSGEELRAALTKIHTDNGGAIKGLIIDLRNNPGGTLGAAIEVADTFLDSGLIVYTEGRLEDARMSFSAKPPDELAGTPIVVLVNGGSASAAEIVAGALQDHKRALIMGARTFGKGSVQSVIPVGDDEGIKITTARYFTPNGRSIQAEGIVPDIKIDNVKLAEQEDREDELVKESQLDRHLDNPNGKPAQTATSVQETKSQPLAASDYELYEALNMLKGLVLVHARLER